MQRIVCTLRTCGLVGATSMARIVGNHLECCILAFVPQARLRCFARDLLRATQLRVIPAHVNPISLLPTNDSIDLTLRMQLSRFAALAADSLFGRIPDAPCPGAVWGPRPERGLAERRSARLAWRTRLSGPGGRQAASLARLAANRVFAIESSKLPFEVLAAMARRELGSNLSPTLAMIDSLALAATAAHRCLGLRPHLPQLTAAALMLDERVAELPTGEGKTLAIALAAIVRALSGVPVHVLVASDARAARDLGMLEPLYRALGVSAMCVPEHIAPLARGEHYRADVCYASPSTMMSDYLLDAAQANRRLDDPSAGREAVQVRGLCSAFVDDADVLLLDRAERAVQLPSGVTGRVERLSTRSFLKRYWRLAGVSATASESRRELARLYGVDVVAVKSIYPSFQRDLGWRLEPAAADQRRVLVARVGELREARRAVLIAAPGRAHVAAIHAMLQDHGIDALRFDGVGSNSAVAEIHGAAPVAAPGVVIGAASAAAQGDVDPAKLAGRAGAVSIRNASDDAFADVVPDPIARAAGGLALITLSLGASRRDDRQRRGWVGRQGQPGTVEAILDAGHALNLAGHRHPTPWLAWLGLNGCPRWLLVWLLAGYRRSIEARQTGRRMRTDRAESRDPVNGIFNAAVGNEAENMNPTI